MKGNPFGKSLKNPAWEEGYSRAEKLHSPATWTSNIALAEETFSQSKCKRLSILLQSLTDSSSDI